MSQSSSPIEQIFGLLFGALVALAAACLLARRMLKARKAAKARTEQRERP